MEYWVECPDGEKKSLEECEKCPHHDGIALRDSKAFLRPYPIPNCDCVCCTKNGRWLVPIRFEGMEERFCDVCKLREECNVR